MALVAETEKELPAWHETAQEGGPTAYRAAQGILFIKRNEAPTSNTIVRIKWPLGRTVATTGLTWTGPSGGVWAELNASAGDFGWALVQGPGFGVQGPLLVDYEESNRMLTIRIQYLGQTREETRIVYETMVDSDDTVEQLTKRFAKACNLNHKLIMLTKGLPGKQPNGSGMPLPADYTKPSDLLQLDQTLGSYGFKDEQLLHLVYTGYWEDYRPA